VLPTGMLTVSLMLLLPDAVNPVAPPVCDAVKTTPLNDAGNVSATTAPETLLGPRFVTTMVYVTDVPGIALAVPSVFVMRRSACGASASVSVAELLPVFGSVVPAGAVTVAVSTKEPVADELTVAVTV
jgi:hypothetical protein